MANETVVKGTSVVDDESKMNSALGAPQKQEGTPPAPAPETQIKDKSNGGDIVRKFVTSNVEAISDAYDFTTVFIDTDAEYNKYGVTVPSVALICTDLRKTIASLKRDPLVIRFNKSKTLKRISEWAKGKFQGFDKQVWFTMYSSAKAIHMNESEEMPDMTYFGFINEDGSISMAPGVGDMVTIKDKMYPIVEASDCFTVQNGLYSFRLDESEVSEVVTLDESTMDGKMVGDFTVMGMYGDALVLSDANDICYLYEAGLDVESLGVQQGYFVLKINGKTYRYQSEQYSSNELEEKYLGIAKHSIGRALAWLKKNAKSVDSYRKSKTE